LGEVVMRREREVASVCESRRVCHGVPHDVLMRRCQSSDGGGGGQKGVCRFTQQILMDAVDVSCSGIPFIRYAGDKRDAEMVYKTIYAQLSTKYTQSSRGSLHSAIKVRIRY
jgi:hypothetical protein